MNRQIVNPGIIECSATDSAGRYCEVRGQHDDHWISNHTIAHERIGNGWDCSSILPRREPMDHSGVVGVPV